MCITEWSSLNRHVVQAISVDDKAKVPITFWRVCYKFCSQLSIGQNPAVDRKTKACRSYLIGQNPKIPGENRHNEKCDQILRISKHS